MVYNLAKYPEIQQKVYEEILDVMGSDPDEPITLRKLNDLHYLDLVVKESLRIFPPVPVIGRQTRENIELNGKIYPAGSSIISFIYAMHHNPMYFKDPEE